MNDEEWLFADEENTANCVLSPWKLLVVDDDQSIHDVTKLALSDFVYMERGLEILQAYSAAEAKTLLSEHDEIAVILLDVVMESDHAGLKLAQYIREDLNNLFVRIILRTGQPGQAPEQEVILNYDINDYKEKTELTVQKLFTSLVTALRNYNDLILIQRSRSGLEKMIDATTSLFQIQSLRTFSSHVLEQLLFVLSLNDNNAAYIHPIRQQQKQTDLADCVILAGTGIYATEVNKPMLEAMSEDGMDKVKQAIAKHQSLFFLQACVICLGYGQNNYSFVYIEGFKPMDDIDKNLITLFGHNIDLAYAALFMDKREHIIE